MRGIACRLTQFLHCSFDVFYIAGAVLLCTLSSAARADSDDSPWTIDGDSTASYDHNETRALFERDRIGEYILSVSAGLSYSFDLGLQQGLTVRGALEGDSHQTVKDFNRSAGSLDVIYRFQTELGFYEPFYQISLRTQRESFAFTQRDADSISGKIQMSMRLTDNITSAWGLDRKTTDSDGSVFDVAQSRVFLNADYRMDQDWLIYTTLGYARGSFVSSAQRVLCDGSLALNIFPLIAASDAIEQDDALNDTFCGEWLSYRVEGKTKTATLGLNRGVGHDSAIDLSLLYVKSDADGEGDLTYYRRMVRVAFMTRF